MAVLDWCRNGVLTGFRLVSNEFLKYSKSMIENIEVKYPTVASQSYVYFCTFSRHCHTVYIHTIGSAEAEHTRFHKLITYP